MTDLNPDLAKLLMQIMLGKNDEQMDLDERAERSKLVQAGGSIPRRFGEESMMNHGDPTERDSPYFMNFAGDEPDPSVLAANDIVLGPENLSKANISPYATPNGIRKDARYMWNRGRY